MADTIFSSQSSDALSAISTDMKDIIAMWDPRPGDNSLGPDFHKAPPQEVASLEQKFESAQDMLLQRTSSLGKRDYSALIAGEGSRTSLEMNGGGSALLEINGGGGTPKMLRLDSSKDSFGKGLLGEGTRHGFERNGLFGGGDSEGGREGGIVGPTSFAGLFMQPPLIPGAVPLSFRPPIPLQALSPFPRTLPPNVSRSIPLNPSLNPALNPSLNPPLHPLLNPPLNPALNHAPNPVPNPPLNPLLPPRLLLSPPSKTTPLRPERSNSEDLDSERSSDAPSTNADPSVHGSGSFARGEGKLGRSPSGGVDSKGDADPQKTQREKNMLKSRRHRLRKKAQETLLREKIVKLEAELAGIRGELNRVANEGRREIVRLQEENVRLRTELTRRSVPLRDPRPAPVKSPGEQGVGNGSPILSPAEELEKLRAENRTLKEGYRNVLGTMNELMQTKAS